MEKKLWYAVMLDNEDTDHEYGSFDKEVAIGLANEYRIMGWPDAYVAVIDPEDDFCIDKIRDFEEVRKMDIKKMCMEQFERMCKLIFDATDPEDRSIHADKADGFILGLLWANVIKGDEFEELSKTITDILFPA